MSQEPKSTEDRLAHLLALAINLEPMLFEEVVQIATTDNLTGAYNLSFFRANLKNELKRGHLLRYPVGLLLVDVELPDDIEQQYRILAADQALQSVANAIEQELRVTDWLARYDSDEFAVVLPGCPPKQLEDIAQRLLNEVTAITIPLPNEQEVKPQAFIGGTVYLSGHPDPEEIVSEAEAARTEARRQGPDSTSIRQIGLWARGQSMAQTA